MNNHYLRRAWRLLCLCLLLAPALGYAQPSFTRVYKIVNRETGYVLGFGEDFNRLATVNYAGGASQQWKFARKIASGTNVYEVINRSSGLVITAFDAVNQGSGSSVEMSSRVGYVNGVQTNDEQLWELRKLSNISPISYEIVQRASGLLLTADEHYVTQRSRQASGQVWDLVDVSTNPTLNQDQGLYTIRNVRSQYLLTVYNYPTGQHPATLGQYAEFGGAAQEWTFMPAAHAPGYFHIVNRADQWTLEIGGGALDDLHNPGRYANLWYLQQGPNQTWGLLDIHDLHPLTLAEVRNGRPFILWNYHTKQCLEMGDTPFQWALVPNQWQYLGTDNQMWTLQYTTANRTAPGTTATTPQGAPLSTGETAPQAEVLGLWPNPAQTTVKLALPGGAKVTSAQVLDLRGAAVAAGRYRGQGQLDVSDLAPGLYMVTASDGAHTYRQRLIKQ